MDDAALEAALFDDLYAAAPGAAAAAGAAAYLAPAAGHGIGMAARPARPARPAPAPAPAPRPLRARGAGAGAGARAAEDRLREIRRASDAAVARMQQRRANQTAARLDQALAAVFAEAIAHRRETQERQRPASSVWKAMAPADGTVVIVDELAEAAHARFAAGSSLEPGQREIQVSNKSLEDMVRARLEGLRTDALQGLLAVFGLPQRPEDPNDAFDKLQIISREFASSLETSVDESQITAYLQISLRGSEDSLDDPLEHARRALRGVPHLYLLEQDQRLRFRLGRLAACYVRVLVLLYNFKLDVSAANAVDAALSDVVLVVRILTQCVITEFPILGTAMLASINDEDRRLDAQPGNRPLNEKASLVCRCAIEEAVAAPLYRGVVAPLYAASEQFASEDRRIADATAKLVAENDPHALLRRLQASEPFVLADCAAPYAEVVDVLAHVWNMASPLGSGPTTKARLLVRASRTIPLAISRAGQHGKHEIGADDLLPIFCFATIWSRPRNLASLAHYLEHCVAQSLLTSEAGYALALLQTALQTIPGLLDSPPTEASS